MNIIGYLDYLYAVSSPWLSRVAFAKAQGQDTSAAFWSGFVSSGFAAPNSMGKELGTVVTIVVAGTVSEISGGKFANGAVTATYIHLFNTWGGLRALRNFEMFGPIGLRGSQADKDNYLFAHEQFFFDDGSTIGYGDKGMIKSGEDISEYSQLKYYEDNILKQAVDNIGDWKAEDYSNKPWKKQNCQTYGEAVKKEYYRLGGK